jgi:antitoxin component YwqK of YwqJK toxin-antitoxin module
MKRFKGKGTLHFFLAGVIAVLLLSRCATPQELRSSCSYKAEYMNGDSCLVSSVPVEEDFYRFEPYYMPCFESVNTPDACLAAKYPSGQVAITMSIRNWQMEGRMTVYYPNGKRKEERFYVNDDYGREYTTWFENGGLQREVMPVQGTNVSRYKTWDEQGDLVSEGFYTYSDTISRPLYDSIINYWIAGQQVVKNGNGALVYYYGNGKKRSEMPVVNGKAEGTMRVWDASGTVIEEYRYAGGLLNGPYFKADAQGRIVQRGFFSNGARDSTWTEYYITGAVRSLKSYRKGSECGQFCEFYENGQKALEYFTSMGGKIDGEERQWHPNGQLKCAGSYSNGYRHGTFAWFSEDGARDFEKHYSEGKEVGITCYRNGKRLKKCPRYRL